MSDRILELMVHSASHSNLSCCQCKPDSCEPRYPACLGLWHGVYEVLGTFQRFAIRTHPPELWQVWTTI